MAKKVAREVVALSAAAILAAYGAGYALTQPTADALEQARIQEAGVITLDAADAASYRDGTYSATGTSQFGDVTVSLTLRRHRIVAVTITQCTTSYDQRWIAGLPGQVLARQSDGIDLVSGATYSSDAFHDAVQQALKRAHV